MPEPLTWEPEMLCAPADGLLSARGTACVHDPNWEEGVSLMPFVAPERLLEPKESLVPIPIEFRFEVD